MTGYHSFEIGLLKIARIGIDFPEIPNDNFSLSEAQSHKIVLTTVSGIETLDWKKLRDRNCTS